MFRRATAGFSALEMVIATAIFGIIALIAFGVTNTSSASFQSSMSAVTLETKGERALKQVTDEISDGTAVGTNAVSMNGYTFQNAEIRFKVPVAFVSTLPSARNPKGISVTLQGPATNPPTFPGDFSLKLVYGWRDPAWSVTNLDSNDQTTLQGPNLRASWVPANIDLISGRTPDGIICFRFVLNPIAPLGANGIFDESVEQIDIDGDGLRTHQYAIGYLERFVMVDNNGDGTPETVVGDTRRAIADSNILQPIPTADATSILVPDAGDMYGYTETSRKAAQDQAALQTKNNIFLHIGPRVYVNLWLMTIGPKRIPLVTRKNTIIFLRNG